MKRFGISVLYLTIVLIFVLYSQSFPQSRYAVSVLYTPVLNTPDFESVFGGSDGSSVKLDNRGLIGEMEFIAFPNTVFSIIETIPKDNYSILKITTNDYPYFSSDLFIDSRFVRLLDTLPEDRNQSLPEKSEILFRLKSFEGLPYMWGGNYGEGIEQLLEFYKPASEPDTETKSKWCLKGVDCSGLLYQVTDGSTPRNTSSLITYGEGIDIQNKNAVQIYELLKPLDLIVWSGHVIIVLDDDTVIQSTPGSGVHRSDLLSKLKSVLKEKIPVNDWKTTNGKRFVVRRWIE